MVPLLNLPLRRQRDVLFARQHLRQIVRLLGLSAIQQLKLNSAVFELCCRQLEKCGRARLSAALDGDVLRIWLRSAAPADEAQIQLAVTVPRLDGSLSAEDLPWVVKQMRRLEERSLFDEIRQHNQDILAILTKFADEPATGDQLFLRPSAGAHAA